MKKEREVYYLSKARAVYPDLPSSTPIISETPDFVFVSDEGRLGIEIVDYIRGLSSSAVTLRTLDNLRAKVTSDAQSKFEAKYGVPLWVGVHWNSRYKFTKRDVGLLGSKLAELVEKDIPSKSYEGSVFGIDDYEDEPIFDCVHKVSVTRLKHGSKGLWASIEAGFVGVGVDEIREFIRAKEAKVKSYLANCDEVWLLIVADGRHISSTIELKLDNLPAFSSGFARVLLYDGVANVVTRLR